MLVCDASNYGISGILLQNNNLVGLFSQKLLPNEMCLSVCDKERFAISRSLEYFKSIIVSNKVFIKTDNKNLAFIEKCSRRTRKF